MCPQPCAAWHGSCVNPHLRAGLEELLRQGPWAPGTTEAGLGLLTKLPRLTEALGAHREPLPWLRVQPHRSRRVTTPVSLTPRALRPLHYLLDLKYSSYNAKMKKVRKVQGLPGSHGGHGQPSPVWFPGLASCIGSSCEAISNAHCQAPPSADKVRNTGEGTASRRDHSSSQAQLVGDLCPSREEDEVITCAKCFQMREDRNKPQLAPGVRAGWGE